MDVSQLQNWKKKLIQRELWKLKIRSKILHNVVSTYCSSLSRVISGEGEASAGD